MVGKMNSESWKDCFRLLVENVKDYAFFLLDPAGRVMHWNMGAQRMLGYSRAEIGKRHFSVFYTPEDRQAGRPETELRTARTTGRCETEGWRLRKNGLRFWASEVLMAMRDGSGRLRGFARVSRDLTERREAEDALRMMNESLERRVRERTAALESYQRELKSLALQLSRTELQERQRLAADLHSNLAQLLALCEIKLASLTESSAREKTGHVLEHLRDYIDQAIHYTRSLMSRLSPPVKKRRHLAWAIKAVIDEMETHGLKVQFHDDCKRKPVEPEVLALLYQGVRELLFNVLKHAGSQRVKVSLRCGEKFVEVHVRDYGVGFSRSSRARNGTGFGLLHLRERLALLGGHLDILRNGSQGTHVLMAVPRKKTAQVQDASAALKQKLAPRKAPIRVLIVDDNKLMRQGLSKVLGEQPDLRVVGEAATGQAAVALARRLKPDVVLMDVNMPGMDGIEATRQISRGVRRTSVIGFSIHEDKHIAEAIKKAGACAYVAKQESPDKLYAVIRHHSGPGGQ